MNRSAASSSPASTRACALRCCQGRNAGSSTPSRGWIRSSGSSARKHVPRAVLRGGEPGRRDRLGGDVTLEGRGLLLDRPHVRLGDRPVAASRRHIAGRPVRQGDDPAILGLDRQRDRSLARHHGAVPRPREVLGAVEAGERQRRHHEQAPLEALRGRGLERRARPRQVAVAEEQEALHREQDEPGSVTQAPPGSSSQRSSAACASPASREAEPECQRRRHEQTGGRVVGRERHARCAHSMASRPCRRAVARKALRCAIVADSRASSTSARRSHAASASARPPRRRRRTRPGRPGRCPAADLRRSRSARPASGLRRRRPSTASPRSPPAPVARDRRVPASAGSLRSGSTRRSTTHRVTSRCARAPRGPRAARRW